MSEPANQRHETAIESPYKQVYLTFKMREKQFLYRSMYTSAHECMSD